MSQSLDSGRRRDAAIFLLAFALFVLASPFFKWWATPGCPWYAPFLVWAGIILLIFLLMRRSLHHHDL